MIAAERQAVEKPEEGKSPNTNRGDFPSSLENANTAFPTFPPPRLLLLSTKKMRTKGDISNEVTWGTFLTSYDIAVR
jgi:hypothetical protein